MLTMRAANYAAVAICTFMLTRWLDSAAYGPRSSPSTSRPPQLSPRVAVAAGEPLPPRRELTDTAQGAATSATTAPVPPAAAAADPTGSIKLSSFTDYYIVIGMPVGINEKNRDRRQLLRKMWIAEYPNIGVGKTVRAEFVIGLSTYQGEGHEEKIVAELHSEQREYGDLALVNAREATMDPYRGDPKNTGEKLVAWFRYVTVQYARTPWFIKADWDTWIHTVRLEHNLRYLEKRPDPPKYFGNTLWCSYSVGDFQPCGYGFGPLQAKGAQRPECSLLPRGSSAVGPYPYAAGLFWGMSRELVSWIGGSRLVYDFAHNASERFAPPYWVKGEDSAFGFFAYISPYAVTPHHWGWNVVHDGWEFRSQKERGLCTQHVSNTTLVVHSMHTTADFELARRQLRERVDATSERAILPFEVDGLADLCARNKRIPTVYAKCEHVGYKPASDAVRFTLEARPRPKCTSVGEHVSFIADKAEGGTITCV